MAARTKIIATLGPASNSEAILRRMFRYGVDIVRLNFSHGSHEEHLGRAGYVRSLNRKMRRSVKIMQDLEGYRIRVGRLPGPVRVLRGGRLYLSQEEGACSREEISFDYRGGLRGIKKGAVIYIDDGKIILEVDRVERKRLSTVARTSGEIRANKGINISGARLDFDAVTPKDMKDIEVAIRHRFGYIAQSFVRNAKDITMLKDRVHPRHHTCKIFAKVENQDALDNIDEIIDAADGVIVARGDLGISMPLYKVPVIQKEIIKRCRLKRKPVAVATQMLESMTENTHPTRAEVSDVANAILDGATHLLVSGETAVGKHPGLVIEMMSKIIKHTEHYRRRQKEWYR